MAMRITSYGGASSGRASGYYILLTNIDCEVIDLESSSAGPQVMTLTYKSWVLRQPSKQLRVIYFNTTAVKTAKGNHR